MKHFKAMASHMRKDIKPWFQYLTAETGPTLKMKLHFQQGGMNMGTYKTEQKGYYLSIIPTNREVQGEMVIETVASFAGMKFFIEPAERYNIKRLTMWAEIFDPKLPGIDKLWKASDKEGILLLLTLENVVVE